MHEQLKKIAAQKEKEIKKLHHLIENDKTHPLSGSLYPTENSKPSTLFETALKQPTLAIIAEIKRQSPSKGVLSPIPNPTTLATQYIKGGATALSILTDQKFFGGTLTDLRQVRKTLKNIPILRKDFILDTIQIAEAKYYGANAVLLIAALLQKKLKSFLNFAHQLGIEALVEIHDEKELDIALAAAARIIGINNRNLNTFEVNPYHGLLLREKVPNTIVNVAESGIDTPSLAKIYHDAGFNAVLIGEALVKHPHPEHFIEACHASN